MSPDDRNPGGDTDEPFFARWARRKAETNAGEPTPTEQADAQPATDNVETEPNSAPGSGETAELDAEDLAELPDPDTLEPGDDFSVFMKSGVPTALRNRALRKLWLSNPALANLDELVDYGEDFTDSATVIENLQTAYRVGRGFFTDEEIAARDGQTNEADDADTDSDDGTRDGTETGVEMAESQIDQSSQTAELCTAHHDDTERSDATVASEMPEIPTQQPRHSSAPEIPSFDAKPSPQARTARVRFILDEG